MKKNDLLKIKICIVGLGYVGLPLAIEFGKKFNTVGFDISKQRINELKNSYDRTKEIVKKDFQKSKKLEFTNRQKIINNADVIIVTVPTPIKRNKKPDLAPIESACNLIGKNLRKGSTIIFESTVYPGLSEEICVPILERISNLQWKKDFFIGYSPERINPGDSEKKLINITKIVSGDTLKTLNFIDDIYSSIIKAGTYRAESIKIAEAAKVIENTQRDLNIAFMNELSMIFNKMEIDTKKVIDAASTKWNFHSYSPGLVGGHCIGVDPYYLTHKATQIGIKPQIILSGRSINDKMHNFVINNIKKLSKELSININDCNILILGAAFKENCPDLRNSRVWDLYESMSMINNNTKIHDHEANQSELQSLYKKRNIYKDINNIQNVDILIIATPHSQYLDKKFLKSLSTSNVNLIVDIKSALKNTTLKTNKRIWSL